MSMFCCIQTGNLRPEWICAINYSQQRSGGWKLSSCYTVCTVITTMSLSGILVQAGLCLIWRWPTQPSLFSHLGSALSPAGRLGVAGLTELLQLVQSGPQEVHLLVTVDVLLPQVLVLLLQLLQLVGHPVLDPSCLGLHLLGVSQSLLALEMGVLSRQQSVSVTSNMHHCIRPVLASFRSVPSGYYHDASKYYKSVSVSQYDNN